MGGDDGGPRRAAGPLPQPPPLARPDAGLLGPSPSKVGTRLAAGELGGFDHHLTARWQLYTTIGPCWPGPGSTTSRGRCTRRWSASWGSLLTAAGLAPTEAPVVHLVAGVRTRIGGLRPLGQA